MNALFRLRILCGLGILVLAAMALFLPRFLRNEARAVHAREQAAGASALDAGRPPSAALFGPDSHPGGRTAVGHPRSDLRIQLRSATTPLSRLSLVLEGAGEPRRLSSQGSSVLRELPAGAYRLRSDERWWAAAPVDFELGASAGTRELEFPIEALGPWRARVLDARDGSGLARARLCWRVRGELGDMEYQAELGQAEIALDAGRFQVACGGFLARQSQLAIEASGFLPFTTPWIEFDGQRALDLGDVALLPVDSRCSRIEGRVVADESGAGLEGVLVRAVDGDTPSQQIWVHQGELQGVRVLGEARARSDAQGAFALDLPQNTPLRLAAWLPARGLLLSTAIEAGAPVELRMPMRARILGRVVSTPELRASGWIQGVNVEAAGRLANLALDEDGRFELGGLPAGPVRVALEALEVQTAGQPVLAEVAVRSLQLREGESAEIELRYGVDAQPWSLDGRVLLPDDVEWSMLRAALWIEGDSGPSRFAVIDREGHFRLEGEAPGRARMFLGGASADSSRCCLAMLALDTEAPPVAELDLRPVAVRGSVWDSGLPAAGVPLLIEALDAEPAWTRAVAESLAPIASAAGEFRIYGLRPGSYAIGRVGGPRLHFQLQVAPAGPLELRVE